MSYAITRISNKFDIEERKFHKEITKIVGVRKHKGDAEDRAQELTEGKDELKSQFNLLMASNDRTKEENKFLDDYQSNKMDDVVEYRVELIGMYS